MVRVRVRCIMQVWICSRCISMSARIYQSILTSSLTPPLRGAVSGFGADVVRVAALGCSPDRCRRMSTHITDSLLQARLYGMATVSFGQATVQSLGITYVCVCVYPKGNQV